MTDLLATSAALDGLAAAVRTTAAASGRRADSDAAFDLAEAAWHCREAHRRMAAMRAEAEAREAAVKAKGKRVG